MLPTKKHSKQRNAIHWIPLPSQVVLEQKCPKFFLNCQTDFISTDGIGSQLMLPYTSCHLLILPGYNTEFLICTKHLCLLHDMSYSCSYIVTWSILHHGILQRGYICYLQMCYMLLYLSKTSTVKCSDNFLPIVQSLAQHSKMLELTSLGLG